MSEKMNWIEREKKRIDTERKQRLMQKLDGLEPYTLKQGVNVIKFYPAIEPKTYNSSVFGERKVFVVEVNNKQHALLVNPKSPLYRQIVEIFYNKLQENPKITEITLSITKAGVGKGTRYSVSLA